MKRKRDPIDLLSGRKECFRCDQVKCLTEFSPTPRGVGGVAAYCKPCMSSYQLEKRARDPSFRERLHEYRQKESWKIAHRRHQHARRASITQTSTGQVTQEVARGLYARTTCHYCQKFVLPMHRTIDHKIPLSRGGRHDPSNLTMACGRCNSRKRSLTESEFKEKLCNNTRY